MGQLRGIGIRLLHTPFVEVQTYWGKKQLYIIWIEMGKVRKKRLCLGGMVEVVVGDVWVTWYRGFPRIIIPRKCGVGEWMWMDGM